MTTLTLLTLTPDTLRLRLPPETQVTRATADTLTLSGPDAALLRAAQLPGVIAAGSAELQTQLYGPATHGADRSKYMLISATPQELGRALQALRDLGVIPMRVMANVLIITAQLTTEEVGALSRDDFTLEQPAKVSIPRPVTP